MRWEGFGQDKVGKTVIESFNEQMFQLKARYVLISEKRWQRQSSLENKGDVQDDER